MNLSEIFADKASKPKEKTEQLSTALLGGEITVDAVISFAETAKDPVKASCIEAFEFATRQKPDLATDKLFDFVTRSLPAKAPRIKWESAKVIGNTAAIFPESLDQAINGLINNSEHEGTVVRWSAAFALGAILQLKTKHNKELLPVIEAVMAREEKNSIRKIYADALKKTAK